MLPNKYCSPGQTRPGVFLLAANNGFRRRVAGLMLAFLGFALFLTVRLGWVQLVQGRELATLAANYHRRTVFYRWGHGSEGRGAILDRNLRPFTEASLAPGLAVFASVGSSEEAFQHWLDLMTQYTYLTQEEILQRSMLRRPIPLSRPLPDDLVLPHWIVKVAGDWDNLGSFRRYTYGDLACHVLGFVSRPYSNEEAPGLLVGRLGIEKAYDELLRCARPGVAAVVDANDRLIGGLGYRSIAAPAEQPNVVLSLDIQVQQTVEAIFDDYIARGLVPATGAIVVMAPQTGDVLAMVSRPAISGASYQHNRATRKSDNVALLPLASVVKVVTAAAALEQNPDLYYARYNCSGSLTLGDNHFICAFGPHGEQDMTQALANSCNIYFAQLAREVGRDDLLKMAAAMGLGQRPAMGLPESEVGAGNLPDLMDLATASGLANHFAMGGNKLEVTPLQVAAMLSSVANGGYYVEPRLVLGTNQDIVDSFSPPPVRRERIMRTTTAQLLARMMHASISEGSAGNFDHLRYPYAATHLAAKTGTSDANLPPRGYQIRWNAGFFPWRNPEYVVVYMAEVPPGVSRVRREQIMAEVAEKLAALD